MFNTVLIKIIGYILFVFSLIMPLSPKDLTFNLKEPATEKTEIIIVDFKNTTGKKIIMAENGRCRIESLKNSEWVELPQADGFVGYNEMAYEYLPGESGKITIDCNRIYGHNLEKGTYRLIITYDIQIKTNSFTETESVYEFNVL